MPERSALYAFDAAWTLERGGPLAGADEAGRGAFAGPLVAAGVILGSNEVSNLADSKTLTPALREQVCGEVLLNADALAVTAFPAWWIDHFGLGLANKQALQRSIELLGSRSGCSLADGKLRLGPEIECLPRADGSSAAVAAASVVAKVLRDNAMLSLSERHDKYGFERNRGYGTREHRLALSEVGPCRVHRLSYNGVGG
ncbi:MAG: ribonuclease HII [Rubrobacteraceae bacterium]